MSSPGFAFASAITSLTIRAGTLRVDRHDQGQFRDQDDRRKILHRVVGQVCIDVRADAVGRDRVQQQRVAVGIRFRDLRGGGRAAGAGAIADDDRLSERVGKLRPDEPGNEIGRAAGRNGDDELDRAVRIVRLRARDAEPEQRQRPRQRAKSLASFSSAGSLD